MYDTVIYIVYVYSSVYICIYVCVCVSRDLVHGLGLHNCKCWLGNL